MKVIEGTEHRTSECEIIDISIPGSVDLVVLARFTAATIGARAGFDLDEIDDLRLAVDELSISFGPLDASVCLRFEFVREGSNVTVRCTSEPMTGVADTADIRRDLDVIGWEQARELSEQLLRELVDAHGREVTNDRTVAWLRKQRRASTG